MVSRFNSVTANMKADIINFGELLSCTKHNEFFVRVELCSNFSKKQNNFLSEHKLSPVNLTWLSQVYGKMFSFPISWIVLENVCLNNFNIIFFNDFPLLSNDGWSYCHTVADVIAT